MNISFENHMTVLAGREQELKILAQRLLEVSEAAEIEKEASQCALNIGVDILHAEIKRLRSERDTALDQARQLGDQLCCVAQCAAGEYVGNEPCLTDPFNPNHSLALRKVGELRKQLNDLRATIARKRKR